MWKRPYGLAVAPKVTGGGVVAFTRSHKGPVRPQEAAVALASATVPAAPAAPCPNGRTSHDPAGARLRQGRLYLLGINPDVDLNRNPSLKAEIQEWSAKSGNAYLDESWDYRGRRLAAGTHLIQSRVQELCTAIVGKGPDTSTRQVCASNLIFCRSESEAELTEKAEVFWSVHKAVMRIVDPACILVMGAGKTFGKIIKLLECTEKDCFPSGHGQHCKIARSEQSGQPKVIGIPHFSHFKLGSDALKRIAEECHTAGGR